MTEKYLLVSQGELDNGYDRKDGGGIQRREWHFVIYDDS